MIDRRRCLLALGALALGGCASPLPKIAAPVEPAAPPPAPPPSPPPPPPPRKVRIGLALGGGAARGFAHIGVIKALENSGIVPEVIVGTSAGAVVGSLYAGGFNAFDLQKLAFELESSAMTDWTLFDRGWVKGEALEGFINRTLANRPMEGLKRRFGAVATHLQSGEMVVFATGNTGQAVRASAAVPGVFAPVTIRGAEYVDGGVTSPVPVRATRQLGADFVIAVDISNRPSGRTGRGSVDVLLDAVAIMGTGLAGFETREAEILIRPATQGLAATNFDDRHKAILEGERAGFAAVEKIRERLAAAARGP